MTRYSETLRTNITINKVARTVTTEDGVIYREHEIKRIIGIDPDSARAVHAIKKHFRGVICGAQA